jgi:hypothetical protein
VYPPQVHLVDHAFVGIAHRVHVAFPVERRIDHARLRHHRGALVAVHREVFLLVPDGVAEMRVAPVHLADDRMRVGIEQQLVRVEPLSLLGLVGPVDAIAVELPGFSPGT